jgi:hypothetical protein
MTSTSVNQARLAQQEAREKQRQMWLERAGKELQAAENWDPAKKPDGLAKRLETMVEASNKTECLVPSDKNDIRDRARAITLRTYEKYLDILLERAMAATRDKDRQTEKNEILKEVNEAMNVAIRLGTSQKIRDGVKERLDIIRQTSAVGDSSKAKEAAEREAARKGPAGVQNEHRTFTRWTDPPLIVQVGGRTFKTADWSLGGMLIADWPDGNWEPGMPLDVKVTIDELDGAKTYQEKIEVVRYIAEKKALAVKTRRFASILMQIKRDCDAAGMEPSA